MRRIESVFGGQRRVSCEQQTVNFGSVTQDPEEERFRYVLESGELAFQTERKSEIPLRYGKASPEQEALNGTGL